MKLSVVVPAYNEEEYISYCLDSLHRYISHDPRLLEVIVVNNASTDRTAEVAKRFSAVNVIDEPHKGANCARQRGLDKAQGELVAFLDADTRINETWLDRLYEHFGRSDDLVGLSGPAYFFDMPHWHKTAMKTYYSFIAQPTHKTTGYMVLGSNFVAKRESLRSIGGFDTSIPFYGDDANIGRRLSRVGRIEFDKKFVVSTSGRRMLAEGPIRVSMRYAANYISETVFKKPVTKRYNDIR